MSAPASTAFTSAVADSAVMGTSPETTAATMRSAPGSGSTSASMPYLSKKPSSLVTQTGVTLAPVVFSPKRSDTRGGGVAAGALAAGPLGAGAAGGGALCGAAGAAGAQAAPAMNDSTMAINRMARTATPPGSCPELRWR